MINKKICPCCFEEEASEETNGLCKGCYNANQEDFENIDLDKINFE